jgi:DnaJ-class molecular chaperone
MKDYYKILGVNPTTPKKAIKKLTFYLAKTVHPKKNQGLKEEFVDYIEAYHILYYNNSSTWFDKIYTKNMGNMETLPDDHDRLLYIEILRGRCQVTNLAKLYPH